MTFANSFSDDPRDRSDRTRRSSDTDGSAASIFATRDWLELKCGPALNVYPGSASCLDPPFGVILPVIFAR
jgi:hypothetical protein